MGCVLGFCKQVSEQPLQILAGNVGGEEGTMWAEPARQSSVQEGGNAEMSAMSV